MKKLTKKNSKISTFAHTIPTMGITFIVIGVLIFATIMIWNIKNNILLFTGLLFIISGIAGYTYSFKQKL